MYLITYFLFLCDRLTSSLSLKSIIIKTDLTSHIIAIFIHIEIWATDLQKSLDFLLNPFFFFFFFFFVYIYLLFQGQSLYMFVSLCK